jgi:type I restriction enzyme S subunit
MVHVDAEDVPDERDAILEEGDIIVVRSGAYTGDSAIVTESFAGGVAGYDMVVRPTDEVSPKYLSYCLLSDFFEVQVSLCSGRAAQSHLNAKELGGFPFPVPPLDEQHTIAAYLDRKTAQIDTLIAKKQRLIDLLQEQRTAVINRAVTQGLDPDAPMQDSGIEWLGEVPAHWTVTKLKWLSPVSRGASPRPISDPKYFDEDGEFAWVRIADVTASERYLRNTTQTLSELGSSLSVKRYPGDFFLSIAGSVGKPIITKIKCCIHDGFVYFPELDLNPEFLYYIFLTGEPYKGLGKWGTQLNLNTETVGNIHIAVPPEDEVKQIVDHLDAKVAEMDRVIEQEELLITRLKELRTSLISEVVTGKIDVRDEVPVQAEVAA